MDFGLKDTYINKINSVFASFQEVEEVVLYGSRAKGNFKKGSDIDLTMKGEKLNFQLFNKITQKLDDLLLPNIIDLSLFNSIDNKELVGHIIRVGITFYKKDISEWKEYKLAEITEPIKDTYIPNGTDNLNYIGLEHIEQEALRLNGIGNSSDVTSNKFLFKANDILFGKLRVYFRKVVKTKFNGICSTDIWVLRAKEGFDQDFLFYFVANWDFVNLADGGEGGTRMPRADWNFLKTTEWRTPPLPEQKAIAGVLSSLDAKIDLLIRQNKTLEAMAETLFRQWFVEEAEESWEINKIGKVLKTELGGTPSTTNPEFWDGDVPWINSGEINKFRIAEPSRYITKDGLEKSSTKLLPKGTTVIAITGATLGQVSLLEIETCANQSVVGIIPNDLIPKEYLFLWIKNKIDDIILSETGGAQPHINKNDVNNTEIIIPPSVIMQEKIPIISKFFNKITSNVFNIRTLEKLRDTLLPKLMSGEKRLNLD